MEKKEIELILQNLEERDNKFYEKLKIVEWHNYQKIYDDWQKDILRRVLWIKTYSNYS